MSENFDHVNDNSRVTIKRGKHDREHPYFMLSKSMIRDKSLSVRDKGALCFMLSLPDDWVVHPRQIAESLGVSKNQMYSIIKSLIESGYCIKTEMKNSKGHFSGVTYSFYEEKLVNPQQIKEKNTLSQKRETDNRDTEKGTLLNTYLTDYISLENITPPIPPQIPKADAMPAEAGEKKFADPPKEKPKEKKPPIEISPDIKELAEKLIHSLANANPDWRIPKNLYPIHSELQEMICKDQRKPQDILSLFLWAINDSFWLPNFSKPNPIKYLRLKYGELAPRKNAKPPPNPHKVDRRVLNKDGSDEDAYKDFLF